MENSQGPFFKLLTAEVETAQALLSCLKEENEAVQQAVPEQLERVLVKKIELLKEMTQHAIDRADYLASSGFSAKPSQIETYIHQHAREAEPLWQQLMDSANRLADQNQINGGMIQLSQQRTQMALDIIARPDSEVKTYGKQGYTEPDATSYTSVKA